MIVQNRKLILMIITVTNVVLFVQVAPVVSALKNASNKMIVLIPPYSLISIDLLQKSESNDAHASL